MTSTEVSWLLAGFAIGVLVATLLRMGALIDAGKMKQDLQAERAEVNRLRTVAANAMGESLMRRTWYRTAVDLCNRHAERYVEIAGDIAKLKLRMDQLELGRKGS